jgi:hypothetical protein
VNWTHVRDERHFFETLHRVLDAYPALEPLTDAKGRYDLAALSVRPLWQRAKVSDRFKVTPHDGKRPLDLLSQYLCVLALEYAEAKKAFDHAEDDEDLEPWRGNKLMDLVKENTFALHRERARAKLAQIKTKRKAAK